MSEKAFLRNFRVSRDSFGYICRSLAPVLLRRNTNFRLCVPVEKRVAVALWKLGSSREYRRVSQLFGVGIATVCCCLQDFCTAALNVLLPEHIRTPDGPQLRDMAAECGARWGAPLCVGAIVSCHIHIIAPPEHPWEYQNTKGWHSVILQVVVGGWSLFWDVCVGYPGRAPHARVLTQSKVGRYQPNRPQNQGGRTETGRIHGKLKNRFKAPRITLLP